MKALLLAALIAGTANAAAFAVDGNVIAAVGTLIATVVTTLAVVRWIDKRIDHKIQNYAGIIRWRQKVILQEISGLRELLGHPPLNVNSLLDSEEREKESA